jgi:hypothetical protein
VRSGDSITIDGRSFATLAVPPHTCDDSSLPVSFEGLCGRLKALPRMFVEPDGSFVQVSNADASPWQLNGNFVDRAGSVTHIELKGNCPREDLQQLLCLLGRSLQELSFQLVHEGVFLANAEFISYVYD